MTDYAIANSCGVFLWNTEKIFIWRSKRDEEMPGWDIVIEVAKSSDGYRCGLHMPGVGIPASIHESPFATREDAIKHILPYAEEHLRRDLNSNHLSFLSKPQLKDAWQRFLEYKAQLYGAVQLELF